MPRYFLNDEDEYLLMLGDDDQMYYFTEKFEPEEEEEDTGDETDEAPEEEEITPVKPKKTKVVAESGASDYTFVVDKHNWRSFEKLGKEELAELSAEGKKAYKKQYSKHHYYATKSTATVEDEFKPNVAAATPIFHAPVSKEVEPELPVDAVNTYGRMAVEVVLSEMNRGIGFTAEEIFEQGDKRLKIFTVGEIIDIYEQLENAGLKK